MRPRIASIGQIGRTRSTGRVHVAKRAIPFSKDRSEGRKGAARAQMVHHTLAAPLALTSLGALGTAAGGALVTLPKAPGWKELGIVQAVAAGMMLSISFLDLMPEAMLQIGFLEANVCFFGGVLFFALISKFVPEPEVGWIPALDTTSEKEAPDENGEMRTPPTSTNGIRRRKQLDNGAPQQVEDKKGNVVEERQRRDALLSGLVTALGIAIHNFPEGIAVFLASVKDAKLGLSLAVAIALHNIPEGIAVAMPVYFSTNSRWKAFGLALLSGLAEPVAVIVVGVLFPLRMDADTIDRMIAGVAGIMAYLSLHELLPLSFKHAGREHTTWAIVAGMMAMSFSLYWLENA
uniref:Uncharacterized protein n=1 Tax=Picocystis salinarum TaxID=88271 RepID=A0A7S3XBY5_9CHLO|mmetsp:Transcript_286/g.2310  ORF Transcript_286/g.2310 Transcript_286/m.2310 type:complete len:348 (+) Transcript_286:67-1110(+)